MTKFLRELFGLCPGHRWVIEDLISNMGEDPVIPTGRIYVQKCTNCGKLKQIKLKAMHG